MGRIGYLRDEFGGVVPWFRRGRNRIVAGIGVIALSTALPWVQASVSGDHVTKGAVMDAGIIIWTVLAALAYVGVTRDWDRPTQVAAIAAGVATVGLFALYVLDPGFGYPLVPGFDTPPENVRPAPGLYVLLAGGLLVISGGVEEFLDGR